jgi:hypothetical protein
MRRVGVLFSLAADDPDTKARLDAFRHELESDGFAISASTTGSQTGGPIDIRLSFRSWLH